MIETHNDGPRIRGTSKEQSSTPIDLRHPLSFWNAVRFPLQSRDSRRDILIGGLWLLVPVIGWLMNMGHRLRVVHRMQHGLTPWPAWENPRELLRHGVVTFMGMVWYGWPGVALIGLGTTLETVGLTWVGVVLFLIAVSAIPGYMSHYCRNYDWREIFDPFRALSRVHQGGAAYWKAWSIVIPVMLCSFGGLLFLGIGFLWTSVWFWQVAAFCFATVFTQGFDLDRRGGAPEPERPDC